MKVLYGYRNAEGKLKDPVIAIGIFDGLHIGHKRVIRKMLSAGGADADKTVMTFDPHPQSVLFPKKTPPRIMSLEHRLLILERMGLDAVIVIHFTEFVASMPPEEFIDLVLIRTGTKKIYVGSDFFFGRGRKGNVDVLKKAAQKYGIAVEVTRPVKYRRRTVSSTWLRKLITAGELAKAEGLLRRPVSVLGTVVRGDSRGSTLGVPTANIDPHQEVIPPPGVYAVKVDIAGGGLMNGVLNIGFKPTFYGRHLRRRKEPRIEVHVLNLHKDLYGNDIEIFFAARLRNEKRYRSEDALKTQIRNDIEKAEKILDNKRIVRKIERYKY